MGRDTAPAARRLGWNALELLVLSAFAIAQPLYDLLGDNGTFFVAHDATGGEIVAFAVALLVLPPLVLVAVEVLTWLVARPALPVVHTILLGALVALAIAPPVNRAIGDGSTTGIALFLVVGIGAAAAFWFVGWTRTVVRFAWFAPPLFLVLFLVVSPVSALIRRDDPVAYAAVARTETPVVWLVFDEWPLSTIVGPDGQVDHERFPNLGRLADIATWYPNASSLSVATNLTMSSALSGQYAEWGEVPVASAYPTNVFTLLGGSYEVVADESVTRLCPASICEEVAERAPPASLWSDTAVVLTRTLLPSGVADTVVPPMNDRWGGFGEVDDLDEVDTSDDDPAGGETHRERVGNDVRSDQRARFDRFVEQLGGTDTPTFHYLHTIVPHLPIRYVPGGTAYGDPGPLGWALESNDLWTTDEDLMDLTLQRLVLHAQYADEQIGRILDRLDEVDMLDESLLVVMSDHGNSLVPGSRRKARNDVTLDDLLPVPLFVKYPLQAGGDVDERVAQQTDVLPTILDVTGIPWPSGYEPDGGSLLGPPDDEVVVLTSDGAQDLDRPRSATASPTVQRLDALLVDGSDGYTLAPHGDLVGTSLADVDGTGRSPASVTLRGTEELAAADRASGRLPIHVVGTVWDRPARFHVAVAVNGVIAGVGRSYPVDGEWHLSAITDPQYFRDGANDIELFEIDDDGDLRSISLVS